MSFTSKIKPQNPEKTEKQYILKSYMCHFMVEKGFLMLLKMATFPIKIEGTNVSDLATQDKVSDHSNLKTLTFKVFFKDYQ